MKYILYIIMLFATMSSALSIGANYKTYIFADNEEVTISPTSINGTTISCYNVTGASYDICSGGSGDAINITTTFGGEVSGTYDNIVLDNDALDDQYIELSDTFGGDLSGTYDNIVVKPNSTTLSCNNITGATSDLCTIVDTDTTYSVGGTFLDLTGTTFSINEGILTDGAICKYIIGIGLQCIYNESWLEDKQYYYNSTKSNETYINNNGDLIKGEYNYSDGIHRFLPNSSFVIYDTEDEPHLLDADLERFDEIRANVFTKNLIINTFANSSGSYINISTDDGKNIAFIYGNGTSSVSDTFNYNNTILSLINGSDLNPVLNRIYVKIVSGTPTWFVTTSDPVGNHVMASRVLVGQNSTRPYVAALQEDGSKGAFKRIQRRFRIQGLLYEEGLDYNVTVNDFQISSGNFILGIYDKSISNNLNLSNDGFYVVRNDGTYVWETDLSDIIQYSDGNSIGSNKYVNIIWGITPYDSTANLYAVVQSKPSNEYTSIIDAYADNDNTLKVYPSDDFIRINFLPVFRTIFNSNSDEFQILPNGNYAEDYRGGIAGGVSSGGGIAESDPLSVHYDGSVELTSNWNQGSFNLTNTNSWWLGKINYSSIQNSPTYLLESELTNLRIQNLLFYNSTESDTRYWNEDGDTGLSGDYNGTYNINTTGYGEFNDTYSDNTTTNTLYVTNVARFNNSCIYDNGTHMIIESGSCSI